MQTNPNDPFQPEYNNNTDSNFNNAQNLYNNNFDNLNNLNNLNQQGQTISYSNANAVNNLDEQLNNQYQNFPQNSNPQPINPDLVNYSEFQDTAPEFNYDQYNNQYNPTPNQDLHQQFDNVNGLDENTSSDYQSDPAAVVFDNSEKKSGKLFYIITGIISIILLFAIGILAFLIYNASMNTTNTASNSSQSSNSINSSEIQSEAISSQAASSASITNIFTDPKGVTPAQASKVNDDKTLSGDFLNKYFADKISDDKTTCKDELVCGTNIDSDKDGFTNILELNFQTDPTKADTDADGLSDGDEINVYSTSPKEKDSDGDKVDDLSEVVACSDPAIRTFTPFKLTKEKQAAISNSVAKYNLTKNTIDSLISAKATSDDIKSGLIVLNCGSSSVVISPTK